MQQSARVQQPTASQPGPAASSVADPRWEPRDTYEARLRDRRNRVAGCQRRERMLSNGRLLVFAGVVTAAGFVLHTQLHWALLVAAIGLFLALVVVHDTIIRRRKALERAAEHYQQGLRRLRDEWPGTGVTETFGSGREHPFAADLDLFGHGSLFELLCTCRTRTGKETLAQWLRAPAPRDTISQRQHAIGELRPKVDLRERLAVVAGDVGSGVHPETLKRWGDNQPAPAGGMPGWVRHALAALLSGAALVSGLGWLVGQWGAVPFVIVVVLQWGFNRAHRRFIETVLAGLEQPRAELQLFARVVQLIERQQLDSPYLQSLHETLKTDGLPAWQAIDRLERRAGLLDAEKNQFFIPIGFLLHWSVHLTLSIERWRRSHGKRLQAWLGAAGEFEAIMALAAFAFENPDYPFPELVDGEATLTAQAIGHPLIPRNQCVYNDLDLSPPQRVLIVSGSNMSGKSTFLRTVGINTVLAQSGAPVRARSMRLTPLNIGATLRIEDSLQSGESRFYAEITRLRDLVALTRRAESLLFLLDEILAGTNSHDRRIGAAAIVKGLVDAGAIGLVTTHDLALADIAKHLNGAAANVHFEDRLVDGELHFDYKLRDGIVEKSNALDLMRAVGLDV